MARRIWPCPSGLGSDLASGHSIPASDRVTGNSVPDGEGPNYQSFYGLGWDVNAKDSGGLLRWVV